MSLYNMLYDKNPYCEKLLALVNLTMSNIPRIRAVFLDNTADGKFIVVYTRVSGNNRDCYCYDLPENCVRDVKDHSGKFHNEGCHYYMIEQLIAKPEYFRDEDVDETYSFFYFKVPDDIYGVK